LDASVAVKEGIREFAEIAQLITGEASDLLAAGLTRFSDVIGGEASGKKPPR
jgi:hypothetical protein